MLLKKSEKRTIMDYFNSKRCSIVLKMGRRGEKGAMTRMSFSNALTL